MGLEDITKDRNLVGPTEALPNYDSMCEALLSGQRNDPLVSRGEINDILGERGNLETLLYSFVKKGFVLHGSPFCVPELEPRKGNDNTGDPKNEFEAVYATIVPSVALFHSLHAAKIHPMHSLRTGWSVYTDELTGLHSSSFRADKDAEDFMGPGYLYILEKDLFVQTDVGREQQYVSWVSVHPRLILPSVVNDFKHPIERIE